MAYGILKVDTVTFTDAGVDKSVSISGLVQNPTFSGNVTVTGTISGVTVTGTTASFTSGNFTNISGGTHTITSGVFAAGSATNPSISFTSDPNTGIYSPGADQVAISTSGSGRLFVDSSGNIGAGSASLSSLFRVTVNGNGSSIVGGLSLRNNGTEYLTIGNANASSATDVDIWHTQNGYLRFATNNQERMRITSDGKVGLGTSSPNAPLMVQGSSQPVIRAYTTDTGTSNQILFDNGSNYHYGAIGTVTGNSTTTGDVFGLGYTAVNTTDFTPVLSWTANTGRVGVGTTGPNYVLDVRTTGTSISSSFTSDQTEQYIALKDSGTTLGHVRLGSTSGSMLLFAGNGERARIDSSGRLLVGTSAARSQQGVTTRLQVENTGYDGLSLVVNNVNGQACPVLLMGKSNGSALNSSTIVANGDRLAALYFQGADGTDIESSAAAIEVFVDGTPGVNDMPGRLVFSTTADGASSPTERMRIGQNGYFKASTNGTYNGTDVHNFYQSNTNAFGLIVGGYGSYTSTVFVLQGTNATSTAFNLIEGYYGGNQTTGGGASLAIRVRGDGDITNLNNSYGAISDIKLKENIVNANSQWDDIKTLQVRNYNLKEGQTHTQIGLIAQEVELVSPGLVSESPDRDAEGNDLGTVTKSVNYSVLYMKAVKALQEAMERIEILETSNTDLLARVSALESA